MANKRPDGDGAVRKRKDGRWEGRIVIGHKNDGKPIFKSVFAKTQRELMPKLHAAINDYKDAQLTENGNMTLDEWMLIWVDEYVEPTLRPNTVGGYCNMIRHHIRPALGNKPLRSITRTDVQRFYNALKKKKCMGHHSDKTLADSTVRGIHMLLHEIMEAAVAEHLIPKNPTAGTSIPPCSYPPMKILNEEQLGIFTEAVRKDPLWCDFFFTEITTGLRRGEICGLKWSDLDETGGRLRVRRSVHASSKYGVEIGETKTETGMRGILLPPGTLHLLKKRKEKITGTEWIFPDFLHPERPVSPGAAYRQLKEILKEAELPDIRFHDLRHTFATHALAGGVDAKTLSGILGHTNASFTLDTYTHVTGDMQKNAAAVVGDFLAEIME